MSLNVVKRPFRAGGKVYSAGTIIKDPAEITLFKNRMREGKIALVDEHNVEQFAVFLSYRYGVEGALEKLTNALKEDEKPKQSKQSEVDEEYLAKVRKMAKVHGVEVDGRPIPDVVAEIKVKAKEAKEAKKSK